MLTDPVLWERWLDGFTSDDLAWIPLHASRVIAAEEKSAGEPQFHPHGFVMNARKLEDAAFPVADFVDELAKFKTERESRIKMKVDRARAEYERLASAGGAR